MCLVVRQDFFVLQNPNFTIVRIAFKSLHNKMNESASTLETQLLCISADSH